jgi:phytoene dehydrogenase-like protein
LKADLVVIGAGVNGLTTAALLAKAGLKPVVLERRPRVGGAAVTEEFHPGFKASTVAHTAGPFRASLIEGLGLARHGLSLIEAEPRVMAPLPDGRSLSLWGDPQRTAAGLSSLSAKDAQAWPEFHASLGRLSAVLGRALCVTPPDLDEPTFAQAWPFLGIGIDFRRLGRRDGQNLLRWGPMAVADFVQEWFETPLLQAVVAARGIHGAFAGPRSAGTTANLLLQAATSGGNGAGSTVFVRGGLGALTEALAAAARSFGAEIRTGAEVAQILTKDGAAAGVVLAGGEEIASRAVVSAVDLPRTFLRMLDPALLDPDDVRRVRNYRIQGMASKVNYALSGLPAFAGQKSHDASLALRGRIHIGSDIDALERAFDAAKYGAPSPRPYLDITIPSITDPGLCPAGQHVMSVYVQYTPFRLKTGSWKERAGEVADATTKLLEEHAPGFGSLVLGQKVLTPHDLEATYGLTGGHPSHGEPALDQLFVTRPLLGWARYRSPIAGLYLCSAGTHPGGGVTGGPGANAAREIAKDLRRARV